MGEITKWLIYGRLLITDTNCFVIFLKNMDDEDYNFSNDVGISHDWECTN